MDALFTGEDLVDHNLFVVQCSPAGYHVHRPVARVIHADDEGVSLPPLHLAGHEAADKRPDLSDPGDITEGLLTKGGEE